METQESARSHIDNKGGAYIRGPPKKYEKLIQKLESDVRGHIRVSLAILELIPLLPIARARDENPHGLPREQT